MILAMTSDEDMVQLVRASLGKDSRIEAKSHPLALDFSDGILIMEGILGSVAAKKLALEQAAKLRGIIGILDRLRVAPAERAGDGEIARRLGDSLLGEEAFRDFVIEGGEAAKALRSLRRPQMPEGSLEFSVADGVVTLNGTVPGLDYKRLAGVLAWWSPGSQDVINGVAVEPPEEDGDGPVADALRLVLEKDPLVNAARIRIAVNNGMVFLSGLVASEQESAMAENDAWCIFGVDEVVNTIVVRG